MQNSYYVVELLKKVFESSFLVETSEGKVQVVSGNLFEHNGKFFYLDDVIKGILELVEIYHSWIIDLNDLHDVLYAKYIYDPIILESIKQKIF